MKKKYFKNGYYLFKDVLDKNKIKKILEDIKNLYRVQFCYLKINENLIGFDDCLIEMFKTNYKKYIHTFRTATMLPSLYGFAYDESIYKILLSLGLKNPILSQKPNLRMDCSHLAIEKEYYKLPPHQDYKGMQGSINSVVLSIPLVDVDESLGALRILPCSHKLGFLKSKSTMQNKTKLEALKAVELNEKFEKKDFVSICQKQGDALAFSSFTVHESGKNVLKTPRCTLLLKFNDLEDDYFIHQGFPSPQKTIHESIADESLNYSELLEKYFNHNNSI